MEFEFSELNDFHSRFVGGNSRVEFGSNFDIYFQDRSLSLSLSLLLLLSLSLSLLLLLLLLLLWS